MSGSAALSAARRRRASQAPPPPGNAGMNVPSNRIVPPQQVAPGNGLGNPAFPMGISAAVASQQQQQQQLQQLQQQQQLLRSVQQRQVVVPPGMVNARVDPTMLPGQMPPRPGMPVMPVMPGMQEQPNPFGNTGPMPPPIIILKGHDDKLKEHEGRINDVDNRVNHLNDRIDKLDYFISVQAQKGNVSMATPTSPSTPHPSVYQNANGVTFPVMPSVKEDQVSNEGEGEDQGEGDDDVMNEVFEELINNRDFITGVVDKIVNDTNLSEVIKQIEPIIVENRELRSLINSQQELLNQMSTLVFKLMSNMDTGSCVSKQCCENDAIECECNPRSYENQTQENQTQENQAQENQTHVDESAEHNEEEETPEDTDEYECRNGVCFPKQKKAVSESSNTYDPNILLQVIHQDPELSCPEDMSSNISESEI